MSADELKTDAAESGAADTATSMLAVVSVDAAASNVVANWDADALVDSVELAVRAVPASTALLAVAERLDAAVKEPTTDSVTVDAVTSVAAPTTVTAPRAVAEAPDARDEDADIETEAAVVSAAPTVRAVAAEKVIGLRRKTGPGNGAHPAAPKAGQLVPKPSPT
jgi:hypothetical protein